MLKLLLATNNPGKVSEMKAILAENMPDLLVNFSLETPDSLGLDMDVVEDGLTYEENATKKARAYFQAVVEQCQTDSIVVLADDSGLEVAALDGAPGLYSARFGSSDGAHGDGGRRAFLLEKLKGYERPWQAAFHCTVALIDTDGGLHLVEGRCEGEIISEERGEHGFGYDPIFLLPDLEKTMAEISMAEKNKRSHRARAVMAAVPILRELVQ